MTSTPRASAVSRRDFLSGCAAAALLAPVFSRAAEVSPAPKREKIPLGLELYSVRGELQKDLSTTLRVVARMGYEVVEFYSPYMNWSASYAKDVRAQLDDLGLRCLSTHNQAPSIIDPGIMAKAIELNHILGSRHIIAASPPRGVNGLEGWKRACEQFTTATGQLLKHGLRPGYHNHATEWKPLAEGGQHVMQVIATHTPKDFSLQLDVGTALEAGVDTVAWIRANPGRITSVHLKDWTPGAKEDEKAYRVLFGEGVAPWREIVTAAEAGGGVEFYLMEQEGSRFPEVETAKRCLESWRKFRAAF